MTESLTKYDSFKAMVRRPDFTNEVMQALPVWMKQERDRFLRALLTYAQRSPDILKCTSASVVKSIMDSAQLGLMPDGLIGSGYLVPFGTTLTFVPGYRGLIDLAKRTGAIVSLTAEVVREGDSFTYQKGDDPKIIHEPVLGKEDERDIVAAYAIAVLPDGTKMREVMSRAELDKVRNASQASRKAGSPWNQWPDQMYRKCPVKRLFKFLGTSPLLAKAIALDNEAEGVVIETPVPPSHGDRTSKVEELAQAFGVSDPQPDYEPDPEPPVIDMEPEPPPRTKSFPWEDAEPVPDDSLFDQYGEQEPEAFVDTARKSPISFDRACKYEMPFGKNQGKRLDEIADTDDGLGYLIWLANRKDTDAKTAANVQAYLGEPVIAAEVERMRAERKGGKDA